MTVEIPQFNRCCFCLPLRPGLLAWGYFKIIADVLITPFLTYFLLITVVTTLYGGNNKKYLVWILLNAAVSLIVFLMFVTDFVASIMFVIAGHKKNVRLVRAFYIYSIVLLILSALLILLGVVVTIVNGLPNSAAVSSIMFVGCFVILVVQAYFVLLLRSEVIKLNASGQFKFVNNSTEAQCMMASKQNEAAIENV